MSSLFKNSLLVVSIVAISCMLYEIADNKIRPEGYTFFYENINAISNFVYPPPFVGRYALIDIDDKTFAALDYPDHTPTSLISKLIKFVNQGTPQLLIVDISIHSSVKNDKDLIDLLTQHSSFPILITDTSYRTKNQMAYRNKNVLDEVIKGNPNLFWVSTLFSPQADGVVRQSTYFRAYCESGNIIIRPSVAIAARIINDVGVNGLNEVLGSVSTNSSNNCDANGGVAQNISYKLPSSDMINHLNVNLSSFDIDYNLSRNEHLIDKDGSLILYVNSARGMVGSEETTTVSTSTIDGRMVIIGGTNQVSNDIHETPSGPQYGAYLILNAIESSLNLSTLDFPSNKSLLTLLYFAVPLAFASVILRNTALVVMIVGLLSLSPRVFEASYNIEIFTVLAVLVAVEFCVVLYSTFCRVCKDVKDHECLIGFLSEDLRNHLTK